MTRYIKSSEVDLYVTVELMRKIYELCKGYESVHVLLACQEILIEMPIDLGEAKSRSHSCSILKKRFAQYEKVKWSKRPDNPFENLLRSPPTKREH